MKAMIFAAGLGTRLRPLTNTMPKALVEFQGEPLLKHIILRLENFGFTEIVINVHHFAEQIIDYLHSNNNFGIGIEISSEADKLLDTGGGLKRARPFFDNEPFLLHNVDIISDINLGDMYQFHCKGSALATLAVSDRLSSRYFLFDAENRLSGWENTKTGERIIVREEKELKPLAFSGIHVIDPRIFEFMPQKDVFSIIELYLKAAKKEKILSYRDDESSWQDIGKLENLS